MFALSGLHSKIVIFSHNAGTLMCLIFSVIFCLLIIGNGKLNFETTTLPVLCWGFKIMEFMHLRPDCLFLLGVLLGWWFLFRFFD